MQYFNDAMTDPSKAGNNYVSIMTLQMLGGNVMIFFTFVDTRIDQTA